MAILKIPDHERELRDVGAIKAYLSDRGIFLEQWSPAAELPEDASQDQILAAFAQQLEPFMAEGGYQTADVISVFADTEGIEGMRKKFLAEHTHTEDEVRYFVAGQGLFWFNPDGEEPVFSVLCQAGDLISVPANVRHWFDLGPEPHVRAIRIFTDKAGWVPHYTESGVDQRYNPGY
jgi:1,2-dihydroxy-3-keto-5-methylthiopentene dioxygenase